MSRVQYYPGSLSETPIEQLSLVRPLALFWKIDDAPAMADSEMEVYVLAGVHKVAIQVAYDDLYRGLRNCTSGENMPVENFKAMPTGQFVVCQGRTSPVEFVVDNIANLGFEGPETIIWITLDTLPGTVYEISEVGEVSVFPNPIVEK
jgi:hypothetical protein